MYLLICTKIAANPFCITLPHHVFTVSKIISNQSSRPLVGAEAWAIRWLGTYASTDEPALHVVESGACAVEVGDALVAPETLANRPSPRPQAGHEVGGVHVLRPQTSVAPHH